VGIGVAAAHGESGQGVEVGGGEGRLAIDAAAVEPAPPGQRDSSRTPAGAEQRSGDGGDGVGVAARTGCPPQCGGEMVAWQGVVFAGGRRDRRQRALNRVLKSGS
jgi:hypothetical protein